MSLKDLIEGDDLDVFFNSGEFGTEAVFTGTYGPLTVTGLFDPGMVSPHIYTGAVEYDGPTFQAATKKLEKVKSKDTLAVGMVTYEVVKILPGRSGITVCVLNETRDDS